MSNLARVGMQGAGVEPAQGGAVAVAAFVAALIVTHDRVGQLRKTLAALLREAVDLVVVVDNASTDRTSGWLARIGDPRLRVLRLPENRGGAGGFEAGLALIARDGRADWTVLMDDDARPTSGAISEFRQRIGAQATAAAPVGVVAAAVFTPGGRICEMNRPTLNPFWRPLVLWRCLRDMGRRRSFHLPDASYSGASPVDVDVASFVGFFVSRAVVDRIGLPEGGLFIYGDDVLYSLAARRAGFRILFDPAVRFEHDCRSLDGRAALRPMWKVYYLCRNNVAMIRQAVGPALFPLMLLWYLAAWMRKARRYQPEEARVYRRLVLRGVRDGLAGRRGRDPLAQGQPLPTPVTPVLALAGRS